MGRIIAFRLDGGAVSLPSILPEQPFPAPPPHEGPPAKIAAGEVLYNRFCGAAICSVAACCQNLRRLSPDQHKMFLRHRA